ncbi:MAG: cytochrome c oxidase subunit II [Solirubrobacterales bacterium]
MPLWPVAASEYAAQVDWLFLALIVLALSLAAPPILALIVFVVRYREGRRVDRTQPPTRKFGLEVAWTIIPFALTLACFGWAAWLYRVHAEPPATDTLDISVVAKQWMFKFQHPGGQRELDELHVPAGQAVRLLMTSQDVIHSLFLPALRIKQDVLPGRVTQLWFRADRPGIYHLHCAEYCGTNHSLMGTRFIVLAPPDYQRWLKGEGEDAILVRQGADLFRARGCSGCHEGGPGAPVRAPSLKGVFGGPVFLADGTSVIADEAYLRDSILLPGRQIVAGFKDDMPSFAGKLSEGEIQSLVAYVKSLGMEDSGDGQLSDGRLQPEVVAPHH